jgi:hypothetical protein
MPRSRGLKEMRGLRKRYRVLLLAALVAALAVPVGFALSLDSAPIQARVRRLGPTSAASKAAVAVTSSVVLAAPAARPVGRALHFPVLPDAAKLVLVGTVLFGLAAVVRKAV